jgi:cytidyltransferase-like protein
MSEVLTIGTFDSPHAGHAHLFKFCEQLGEVTVGVNSDEFVKKYKGNETLYTYEERADIIRRLGYNVVKNVSSGLQLIDEVNPDFLVIGSDWLRKDYLGQIAVTPDFLDERGISLVYTPYFKGISTSDIKRRVSESNSNSHN